MFALSILLEGLIDNMSKLMAEIEQSLLNADSRFLLSNICSYYQSAIKVM